MNDFWLKLLHEFETPFSNSVLVFAIILFIILLAPLVLKRLRIPGLIGLILSGIVIGPHGLFLIERNSAVTLFSTIGLLYIMFIAGLELDLGEFRKNRNKSLVFGLLTFILPISIGFPVCYYILNYELDTSILTASMFATHTLIAYPIVSRLGIAKNEAVAIAVGGTIFTDTAVLIILAVISGSAEGGLTHQLWIRLGISFIAFLLIVVFIIPRVASWFFKRLEDEKNAHFIFVMFMVFLCAFIAELSGLEPIIGAFAAGLTLNRLIPHTSSLMNRIEFVGNSLFIPFFLISVGMLIDISVLMNGYQAILVAFVLTTVALVGKWLAARITGGIFSYTSAQWKLIFGLSSAHAAATLAVILVGYNLGIIDDNILNGTVILIFVTCLVASFVVEAAGKQIVVLQDTDEVIHHSGKSQRLLVPISNPATMERLIDFAIIIKEPKNQNPIIGLTVVEDNDKAQPKILQARKMLEKAITHAIAADQKIEITATIDQNVANGVKRVTREAFITDIIMGWPSKKKIADIIFGKTFDSVVNQTTQSVFISRFMAPINVHKSLHIFCPNLAEKEPGFHKWRGTLLRMASGLRLKTTIHSTEDTFREIMDYAQQAKMNATLELKICNDLSNIKQWKADLHPNDIVVLISARKESISYTPLLDILPDKMAKHLTSNSLIFVYPEVKQSESPSSYIQETDNRLLERGLQLLKGVFIKKS